LYDVRQQKSAKLFQDGVFTSDFPGYVVRVMRKGEDQQTLYDITIYQKDIRTNNLAVIMAKEGTMYRTASDKFLVLKLKNGVRYEEGGGEGNGGYYPRQTLTRTRFGEMETKFDLSAFNFKRTDQEDFKSAFVMMNIKSLRRYKDSTQNAVDSDLIRNYKLVSSYIRYFQVPKKSDSIKHYLPFKGNSVFSNLGITEKISAVSAAQGEVRTIQEMIKQRNDNISDTQKNIRRSEVEYQKKFTLSVVCLVLFLIGAPLGAIIRKGGLGLPVVVSVIFFLIYYIISTIGEKGVKDGGVNSILGMWISIIVLTPIGIFLSYKAANDSALFDLDVYRRFFNRLVRRKA
jgi:lipopolysaccharide export system permease protein